MYVHVLYILLFIVTSGNSNETAEVSTEGFTGRVLLIVSAVVQLLVWTVAFAAAAHGILGLYTFIINYLILAHFNVLWCVLQSPARVLAVQFSSERLRIRWNL